MSILCKIELIEHLALTQDEINEQELAMQVLSIDLQTYQKFQQRKEQESLCAAPLPVNKLFFECIDCNLIADSVLCQACYQTDKHINHVVIYDYANFEGGFCDCGDQSLLKKNSFCNSHSLDKKISTNQEEILPQNIYQSYRDFIQIAFSLFISKIERIVEFPKDFIGEIRTAIFTFGESSQALLEEKMQKLDILQIYRRLTLEIQGLYKLITTVIKVFSQYNTGLKLITSQLFQESIDKDIQKSIKFYHLHDQDYFQGIAISQQQQQCRCSILELLIKFKVFLNDVLENYDDMNKIFLYFHQDESFRPFLCRQIIRNLANLYQPIKIYKFITISNHTFKISMNYFSYSQDESIKNLFSMIAENNQIKKIITKNSMIIDQEILCFYNFGIIEEILKLKKETQSIESYQFLRIFSERIKLIPLSSSTANWLAKKFFVDNWYYFQISVFNSMIEQIEQLLDTEYTEFLSERLLPQSKILQNISQNSLLVFALSKILPCNQKEDQMMIQLKEMALTNKSIKIQQTLVWLAMSYRFMLANFVEAWKQKYQDQRMGLKNILRIILIYFFNNLNKPFNLLHKDGFNSLENNLVISDRNFIQLLSLYLYDSYGPLVDIILACGANAKKLRKVMQSILQRVLLNYIVLKSTTKNNLYRGQFKVIDTEPQIEVALEQIDITFIQIYASIYLQDGLQDILNEYAEIADKLNLRNDSINLICRIAQSDYDYIQCLGTLPSKEFTRYQQKGFRKLFQTMFFAKSFYSSEELIELLEFFGLDRSFNLEQIIKSFCELNSDNQELQLKKTIQPLYEPVYCENALTLKDQIDYKLSQQNDQFTYLFGNALAQELKDHKNHYSNISNIRIRILEAMSKDEQQFFLQKLIKNMQLYEEQKEYKLLKYELESSAVYINLLYEVNNQFGQHNCVIEQGMKQIYTICKQAKKVDITTSIYKSFMILIKGQKPSQVEKEKNENLRRIKKFQLKKQELNNKFNSLSEFLTFELMNINPEEINQFCSGCFLPIKKNEVHCKPVLLNFTNSHQYYSFYPQQLSQKMDIYSVNGTCCGHLFHSECIRQNNQIITIGEQIYFICPLCLTPYNLPFIIPSQLKNELHFQFLQNLEFFIQTLPHSESIRQKQEKGVSIQDMFDIIDDLFSCILCKLILMLLSDIVSFYQQKQYYFLQDVIMLLRVKYQRDNKSIMDQFNLNQDQVLFKLLKLIQEYLIQRESISEFQEFFFKSFQQYQNNQIIYEMITQNEPTNLIQVQDLPYDIKKLKLDTKNKLMDYFKPNFREFFVKFNYPSCQKKSCNFVQLTKRLQGNQKQYICLICLKKLCSYHCAILPKSQIGNLARHAIKKHRSKSLFLQISDTQIIFIAHQTMFVLNTLLFINSIGQKPEKGYNYFQEYESYKLNLKAVDFIIDFIQGQNQIFKMILAKEKVESSEL